MSVNANRRGLTQLAVVEAAAFVAESGIGAVTMGAVAKRLGVTAMALYMHVRDKKHLMTLLLDSLLDVIEVPPPSVGQWDERLRQLHQDITRAIARYPGLVSEAGEPREVPRLLEGYLRILLEAGFDPLDAGMNYTGFYYLAMGAQVPYQGHTGSPAAISPADPAIHTSTSLVAAAIRSVTAQELEDHALEVYINGLKDLQQRTLDAAQ